MKAFVEYVVKALVDFPNEVDVRENSTERAIVFELRLNKSDIGKVIGKQGRTIQSLRTLVNSAGAKLGKRAMLEIIEENAAQPADSTTENPSPTPAV
jgi:uncharacterized protein